MKKTNSIVVALILLAACMITDNLLSTFLDFRWSAGFSPLLYILVVPWFFIGIACCSTSNEILEKEKAQISCGLVINLLLWMASILRL